MVDLHDVVMMIKFDIVFWSVLLSKTQIHITCIRIYIYTYCSTYHFYIHKLIDEYICSTYHLYIHKLVDVVHACHPCFNMYKPDILS